MQIPARSPGKRRVATVRAVSPRTARCRAFARVLALCYGAALLACVNGDDEEIEAQYQAHLHAGHVALQADVPEDAADAYRRALLAKPEAPDALLGIARSHSARGDGRSALTVLMRLQARHPEIYAARAGRDLRFALYQASKQHLWDGDSAQALRLTKRLKEIEPGHPGLPEVRAEALLRESARFYTGGRVAEAEMLTAELVGRRVRGADAAVALAQVLVDRDRPDLAVSVLSDAQRRHPRDPRIARLLDRALAILYPDPLPPLVEEAPRVAEPESAH